MINLWGKIDASASNADLLKTLKETQQRQTDLGDNTATIAKMPEFESKRDEIMWKLNYAKNTLKKAREVEKMAKKAAVHFGYYDGNKQGHGEVNELIGKADDVLMNAGEKMGFEYEKF